MKEKSSVIKRLMSLKVVAVLAVMFLAISYLSFSGSYTNVKKDGYSIVDQKVYTSQNVKGKSLGSLKKNQYVYVYGSQNNWYQVKYGKNKGWVLKKNVKLGKYVAPPVKVNKDAHSILVQSVYTSQSTKGKKLGSLKKNQNVYIYASQNGWYQVGYGKSKGWVVAKNLKLGKYVAPTAPGKVYPDGWVAPVLKSAWSSKPGVNSLTLQNELGFKEDGSVFGIKGKSKIITVVGQSSSSPIEVELVFYAWTDKALAESYRVPIVAKELFKLYFGSDATRVWNYCNNNDIPETFTANGRKVNVFFSEANGAMVFQVGKK